ncbi:uncharacterized protein BO87DRAFT_383045 [Aspergillus neoniger CBS 115656]|uniref:NAD(P)-binding protein n=1 Tax=Aspergillus neoniger (strain CBS 115656) TaxID=1448310 RepID=A0A318YTS9_ASPNB|nr:hypothetical protein BO87DRAFT_383045 [Aspergillus neoniger CBS 115656]PYH38151.1 hypothetical protein BO87DRAFT_383045 [Aspergillus neoniger CBS 115656]
MSHNILITGASGYLGGTLLARTKKSEYGNYGAEPIVLKVDDHETVTQTIIYREITIVYYLIDAYTAKHQPAFIRGLGEIRKKTGKDVHFLHTTMYFPRTSNHSNVYNPTVKIQIWPVCHISDTAELYLHILRKILLGEEIGDGKHGFFLAASGSVPWNKVYCAMAKALAKRGLVDDEDVVQADDQVLEKMGEALGVAPDEVQVLLGGRCMFTAEHGRRIGWEPMYPPQHILDVADDEVALIMKGLERGNKRPDIR